MDTKQIFSKKAQIYQRYRWDYAEKAVQLIFEQAGLTSQSTVADVGAGTGILTRHFAGKVGHVYAIEPNEAMRTLLEETLARFSGWTCLPSTAEETGLPAQSVDLITVGTAIHWFQPQAASVEFRRIIKPGGWLAVMGNTNTNEKMNQAIGSFFTPEHGVAPHAAGPATERPPIAYFYGKEQAARYIFPFTFQETWEVFFGAMVSQSRSPDPDHPLFPRFEAAARQVFEQFRSGDFMPVQAETELYLDQVI